MVTRKGPVAKNRRFPPQNGDENKARRQKMKFPDQKRRRECLSSSKLSAFHLKMVTGLGFVVKIECFPPQIGDENTFRRRNWAFPASKRRRERVSSSKLSAFYLKMATRIRFVVKIGRFLPKNGDENAFRRQNWAFFT